MKAVIVYGFPRIDDGSEEQEQERRPTISQTVISSDGARRDVRQLPLRLRRLLEGQCSGAEIT